MNKYTTLINSKAVREHLDKINFVPSPFEAAFIVEKNQVLTIKEKHKLWNEIINSMPDEELQNKLKCGIASLHEFLRKYMEVQNKLCYKFLKEDKNAVYSCSSAVLTDSQGNSLISNPFYWCNIYTGLDLCIEDVRKKHLCIYDIRKHYLKNNTEDVDYVSIWADLSPTLEFMNVGEIFALNENDDEVCHFFSTCQSINLPHPFKKGDVIRFKSGCRLWHNKFEVKRLERGCVYVAQIGESHEEISVLTDTMDIEYDN